MNQAIPSKFEASRESTEIQRRKIAFPLMLNAQ